MNLQNWMGSLTDAAKNKLITKLSLPGTHDSAAYRFNGNYMPNKVAGVHIGFLEFLRKTRLAGNIIRDWTLTQDYTITEQLLNGIRVFDLRLSYATRCGQSLKCKCCGGCSKELLLSHSFACITYADFIEQLKDFVDQNPSEIVVVLIKSDHVHRDTLTKEAWEEFIEFTGTYMQDVMYDDSSDQIIPTLKECQDSGKRVFFDVQFTNTLDVEDIPSFTWTTLRNKFQEGYLQNSPSDDYVKTQIINRVFKSCCTEKMSLRNFSPTAAEYLEQYRGNEHNINVWWMDFPQEDITTQLIEFNDQF